MEKRYLKYNNGIYTADIDITTTEWKKMLMDSNVFDEASLKMISYWYEQIDYLATSKEIILTYGIESSGTPFNGVVAGLGKRITRYLNRFEIIGIEGNKSYFIIPFEGWHENYDPNKRFIWKLRNELIQAIDELGLFSERITPNNDELESVEIIVNTPEGKKRARYVTRYERSNKNRRAAMKIHGTTCAICGFDFEKTYGEIGKNFIEVHHINPLYENQDEVIIDPKNDLICVCANCHRMFHRRKDYVPSPDELKKMVKNQ